MERDNQEVAPESVETYLFACARIEGHPIAILAAQVLEIVEIKDFSILPSTDRRILGLATLRGSFLPILSLTAEIGIDDREQTLWPPFSAVLISVDGTVVGVPVDSMPHIVRAAFPPPSHGVLFEVEGEGRLMIDTGVIVASADEVEQGSYS